ncbi:adaptin n terminal region domain-containing protein, partial [Cystoisospora suis]
MAPATIRGVSLFISDVRNCPSSLHEQARILQEIAKIRQRMTHPKKPLTGYEKKKCLTKLLYIHLLGYPVDVGFAEALSLLSSPHYSERAAAYLFCSLHLLEPTTLPVSLTPLPSSPTDGGHRTSPSSSSSSPDDLRRLCCNSIKKDLSFRVGNEEFLVLAL